MRLSARRLAARQVASIETYWPKAGHALTRISEILALHELAIEGTVCLDDTRPGRLTAWMVSTGNALAPEGERVDDSVLVFSWHPMPSGRCEVTAYLS